MGFFDIDKQIHHINLLFLTLVCINMLGSGAVQL